MRRFSSRFLFIISHFTVLLLAVLVFAGVAWKVRTYVAAEMADKQNLIMNQAMRTTDAEIESVIRKAISISEDQYVQWFHYIEEPLGPREHFYTFKLVDSLKTFYEINPWIVDYYVYFGRSGRIANASSFYKTSDYYQLVWSYEDMTEAEWEAQVLGQQTDGIFAGPQMMQRDSTRRELLTYVYQLEKNQTESATKVVLLLDKEYIMEYLRAGMKHGAVSVTDAAGRQILYCQTEDGPGGDLPVYAGDGWKIMELSGEQMLVNGIRSERTGWVYTSYVPMQYVTENAVWVNRLLLTGFLLLMLLGSPLCFYWAQRSYLPVQRLVRILFDSGFAKQKNEADMDYLEQSLHQVLEKQKELEEAYQSAISHYHDLETDSSQSTMWRLFRKHSLSFSAEQRRKLVNYVWTTARVGCEEILDQVYEENRCSELPVKAVHRLYLYVIDMVLIALDDSGIDINRIFENQQPLFDDLLAAENKDELLSAVRKIMEHISYMINENKLDSKELVAKRALEYMKHHYHEHGFSLTVMADELGVSSEHLSRVIKSVTGTNYVETLNQMRLEQTKIYLKTTDLKLEDIAERVGWGSGRYLIRIFKGYEGITPGKYREAGR